MTPLTFLTTRMRPRPGHASSSAAIRVAFAGGRKLSWQVVRLAAVQGHAVVVAKYDGLAEFLRRQRGVHLQVTFEQLATTVPGGLPPSAYRHRAWWANEANGRHVHARAWLNAGWVVSGIDLAGQVVTFQRSGT